MTFSQTTRRWITPAVLAGYVLVIAFSGLFHQHGEGGCCSEKGCSRQAAANSSNDSDNSNGSTCHGHAHHHHHHGTDHCHHETGPVPSERPAQPRTDDPLKHANCAACQLLAELSLTAPTFVLDCAGMAVFRDVAATAIRVPQIVALAHLARGPPSVG